MYVAELGWLLIIQACEFGVNCQPGRQAKWLVIQASTKLHLKQMSWTQTVLPSVQSHSKR